MEPLSNITPISLPNVYPSSINSVTGKLLSEHNLSMVLRSICSRHFIYTKDVTATSGNFNLAVDSVYSTISSGVAIIDGYVVTLDTTTTLSNIPTDLVAFGEIKQFYIALCLVKQNAVENNVGANDPVFTSLSFVFLEDKVEDNEYYKYLYLYKVGVTQNAIDTNSIQDLRVYTPFDASLIGINSENGLATLQDALDFIVTHIRGLEPGTDFFKVGDKTIPIEGENGIYDRLKYKFTVPDYVDKPFINDMIVEGNKLIYSQGQIVTLNGDCRLPNIILPEAEYGKDTRGVIFVDPNRVIPSDEHSYDPDNPQQTLYIENGELYTIAEVNQNAYSIFRIKDSQDSSIDILVPSIKKVDTLTFIAGKNISIGGINSTTERSVTIDLKDNLQVQSIYVNGNQISEYNDPEPGCEKFSGLNLHPAIYSQNGTIEDEFRVGGDLQVDGDINTAGDLNLGGDLNCSGTINADKVYSAVYNDYAEIYECDKNINYQPGDIVGLNPNTGFYELASMLYPNLVVGVVSDSFGYLVGGGKNIPHCTEVPIGMCGRVKVKIIGTAMPGDPIVVSHVDGVGKALHNQRPDIGTVIGKSLQRKDEPDIGYIWMQIMLG